MIKVVFNKNMPENCGECDFEVAASDVNGENIHNECVITEDIISRETSLNCRHEKCPLQEV